VHRNIVARDEQHFDGFSLSGLSHANKETKGKDQFFHVAFSASGFTGIRRNRGNLIIKQSRFGTQAS
jgi:hypothetical protein